MHIVGIVLRYLLGIVYLVGGFGILAVGVLALWAKNWKVGVLSCLIGILGLLGAYESFTWASVFLFWLLLIIFVALVLAGLLYITEPDLGIVDRFKSAKRLVAEGKKEKAALKMKRRGCLHDAARLYEEMGWHSSAALCYEEVEDWEKVFQLYLLMAEEEGEEGEYYLRKAREISEEKLQDFAMAAQVLEKLANTEGWYWEDAAKDWEKVGDAERAKLCWERSLEYYKERAAEDDGVFLADVADTLERLARIHEAVEYYQKFLNYCKEMVEKEERGWLRHVVETYYALARLTGDGEYEKTGDEMMQEYKSYLDEVIKSEDYKEELIEEVKRWLRERVERRP